jgi:hypothetical protein
MTADNSVVKHKRDKPITSSERRRVLNMFNNLCQENPEMILEAVAQMTSQSTGIGKGSIHRIQKEMNANNLLSTPERFCKEHLHRRSTDRLFFMDCLLDYRILVVKAKDLELRLRDILSHPYPTVRTTGHNQREVKCKVSIKTPTSNWHYYT